MLLDVLKRAFRRAPGAAERAPIPVPLPPEALLMEHLDFLYGDVRFGVHRYLDLLKRCASDSGTDVYYENLLRRAETGLQLARYFLRSLRLEGARAECGVFRGMSSLLLLRVAAAHDPSFRAEGYYMFDSFERFSEPGPHDLIPKRAPDGSVGMEPPFPPNSPVKTSVDRVRQLFGEFPQARVVQGYIPAVFSQVPDMRWAFVHLDVDLYEPTRRGLEYFFPRLVAGGIIVTDDYASERYPGARRAWDEYCAVNGVPFVTFGSGQAIVIR